MFQTYCCCWMEIPVHWGLSYARLGNRGNKGLEKEGQLENVRNLPGVSMWGWSGPTGTRPAQTWMNCIRTPLFRYLKFWLDLKGGHCGPCSETFVHYAMWCKLQTFQLSPRSPQIHTCSGLKMKGKIKSSSEKETKLPMTHALCPSRSPGMSPNTGKKNICIHHFQQPKLGKLKV